jgi:hypothetical protein
MRTITNQQELHAAWIDLGKLIGLFLLAAAFFGIFVYTGIPYFLFFAGFFIRSVLLRTAEKKESTSGGDVKVTVKDIYITRRNISSFPSQGSISLGANGEILTSESISPRSSD